MSLSLVLEQRISLRQEQQIVKDIKAVCPKCQHQMDFEEVKEGWNVEPDDLTTACKKCGFRYVCLLWIQEMPNKPGFDVILYCVIQLFAALEKLRINLTEKNLKKKEPALYYSMLQHFGNFDDGMYKYESVTN